MVELETMYPGIAFSPQTKLTAAINETDTVISVESTAGLPDGPNYATIGADENAETIYYAVKLPTQLSGCVRGVEGLAKAWTIGDVLGRNFTAKDYEAILNNLLTLKTETGSLAADSAAHSESIETLEADLTAAETAVAAGKTYTLTHSKSGTVHTLTGVPSLQGVFAAQFRAMADFTLGDTFTDGSNVLTAKPTGEESALTTFAFVAGDLVSVVVDTVNKKLGFKSGSGGGELNFTVVGGTEAPTAPKENTIWVNTDQKITAFAFSAGEPCLKSNTKNLIPYPYSETTHTEDGVTWTDNGDGSVTGNGTYSGSDGSSIFRCNAVSFEYEDHHIMELEAGTYHLSGCPAGGSESTYHLEAYMEKGLTGGEDVRLCYDTGNGGTFTLTEKSYVRVNAVCMAGASISNLTFWPMLEKGSSASAFVLGNADGCLWIQTGTESKAPFNALSKTNTLMVYPSSAKQYISGSWVSRETKIYINGVWVGLRDSLDGCTELEYIEGTGTQYINTGVLGTLPLKVEMTIETGSGMSSVDAMPLACGNGTNNLVVPYWNKGTWQIVSGSVSAQSASKSLVDNTKYTFEAEVTNSVCKLTANGSVLINKTGSGAAGVSYPLFLFARNNKGTASHFTSAKLYSAKLYTNGELVRDFVPAKNTSGMVGLFDKVNRVFHENEGTGAFTAGPVA